MEAQFALLEQFVSACKANPALVHHPALGFYRDYLTSLGATLPPKPAASEGGCPMGGGAKKAEPSPPPKAPQEEEKMEEDTPEEEAIPMPELDQSGVIAPDEDFESLSLGVEGKEPSDEDLEKVSEERDAGQAAISEGEWAKAVDHFTAAIQANSGSAALFAKRAQCLLKLQRPKAAIRDCNRAIALNSDSAAAYKWRGRAERLLGNWVEAYTDLAQACKIDYDDAANEWMKEVEPNAKKMKEYNRAVERRAEEKELNERRERVRRAQEANRAAAAAASAGSNAEFDDDEDFMGGAGGPEMGGGESIKALFKQMFKDDKELMAALDDPTVFPAVQEMMTNPGSMMKHMGNANAMKVFQKLQTMMGPMAGMMGGMGGGGGCADEHCDDSACGGGPKGGAGGASGGSSGGAAPMPDLD